MGIGCFHCDLHGFASLLTEWPRSPDSSSRIQVDRQVRRRLCVAGQGEKARGGDVLGLHIAVEELLLTGFVRAEEILVGAQAKSRSSAMVTLPSDHPSAGMTRSKEIPNTSPAPVPFRPL